MTKETTMAITPAVRLSPRDSPARSASRSNNASSFELIETQEEVRVVRDSLVWVVCASNSFW